MELHIVIAIICHLTFALIANAKNSTRHVHGHHVFNSSVHSNTSTNGTLLPAYYRNTTAGEAWVIPASPFDLGARAMTCECFDPDQNCCMPSSSDIAPFCLPKNATCCADTLCEAGEICCGDYCCRSETICSTDPNNPGCCPKDQTCNTQSAAVCLDNLSPDCSKTFSPPQYCCPLSIPYCRSYGTMGWGCFGTPETSSTSTTTSTNKIPVPTYQPDTTAERAYSGITTLVETISLKFLSSSALSLQFPETITLPSNLAGWSIATTYVFSFPSTIFNTSSTSTTTSSTQSTSSATSSKSSSITTTSSKSSTLTPLCFNPNIQSPIPCSSSSPSSSHPSTSAYPAATTLHSSSPPTLNGPNIYYILSSLALMMAFVHVEFPKKLVVIALWAVNGAWRAWMVLTEEGEGRDSGSGKDGEGEGGNKEGDGDKAGKEEEGSIFKQVGEMTWYITVMPVVMGWEHLRQVIREPVS